MFSFICVPPENHSCLLLLKLSVINNSLDFSRSMLLLKPSNYHTHSILHFLALSRDISVKISSFPAIKSYRLILGSGSVLSDEADSNDNTNDAGAALQSD